MQSFVKRTCHRLITLGLLSACVLSPVLANAAASDIDLNYVVTDLGKSSGLSPHPCAINNSGQVVGSFLVTNGGAEHAFLWTDGVRQDLGAIDAFGFPDPAQTSWSQGLNDSGQVVGISAGGTAFSWMNDFMIMLIPNFESPFRLRRSAAFAVNRLGHVAGFADSSNSALIFGEAFLQTGAETVFLGSLAGSGGSRAFALNSSDQVVGSTYELRAFLYSGGVMTELFPGTNESSCAYAINDVGQIAGYVGGRAFLWDGATVQYLTTPGTARSQALGLNAQGQVVGADVHQQNVPGGGAFVYLDGAMHDLNTLIPAGSGWTLQSACAINDHGQIVGEGTHPSAPGVHAFLLTPVPLLRIWKTGVGVTVAWPKWAATYHLVQASEIKGSGTTWTTVDLPASDAGTEWQVAVGAMGPGQYFRLQTF
jgi:probable HAF family extracellular repeat protein